MAAIAKSSCAITLITQRLWAEPNWLVVLGYSYYAAHRTELLGTMLEGPAPTLATLTDGTYPAARPVYVYAQRVTSIGILRPDAGAPRCPINRPWVAQERMCAQWPCIPLDEVPRPQPDSSPVVAAARSNP